MKNNSLRTTLTCIALYVGMIQGTTHGSEDDSSYLQRTTSVTGEEPCYAAGQSSTGVLWEDNSNTLRQEPFPQAVLPVSSVRSHTHSSTGEVPQLEPLVLFDLRSSVNTLRLNLQILQTINSQSSSSHGRYRREGSSWGGVIDVFSSSREGRREATLHDINVSIETVNRLQEQLNAAYGMDTTLRFITLPDTRAWSTMAVDQLARTLAEVIELTDRAVCSIDSVETTLQRT